MGTEDGSAAEYRILVQKSGSEDASIPGSEHDVFPNVILSRKVVSNSLKEQTCQGILQVNWTARLDQRPGNSLRFQIPDFNIENVGTSNRLNTFARYWPERRTTHAI